LRDLRQRLPLALLLVVAWASVAAADADLGSGFPAEAVTTIHQDRAGFLWIGSREGLYLYDGYGFRVFEHDVSDPGSISDNDIRTIYEDREGRLWIGTNTGGLNRLDRVTWTFEHFRHDSADPGSISHDSIYGIVQDREGTLWVGTQIGLNRLAPGSATFDRMLADPARPDSLSHDYVYPVYEDREGTLWVGTVGGGLNRWDPRSGRFTRFVHDDADPRSISSNQVFAIVEDDRGGLWIGTGAGLDRMDRARGTFERVAGDEEDPDLVTSLAYRAPGTLWVGTFGSGVKEFDLDSRRVVRHHSTPGADSSEDRIVSVFTDRLGTTWIGTWDHGLRRIGPAAGLFTTLDGSQAGGLSYPEATAVVEDRRGTLWIGTWAHGLDRLDPGRTDVRNYQQVEPERSLGTVLRVHEDHQGAIWTGTMGALFRLDPLTDAVRSWSHRTDDPRGLGPGYVTAILETGDGRPWVGIGGSGLYRMREGGDGFDRYRHDPDDPGTLSEDYVTALLQDHRGTLWVGTRSGGLNAFDVDSGRCRRFLRDPSDPQSLSHHYVTSLLEDRDATLWIGTGGGGLNRLARNEPGEPVVIERITERDGLLDDDVMAIVEDDDGSLWLGTKRGLSRYDPRTRALANYDADQGFPGVVFHPGGATSGATRLFFATRSGVVSIPRGTSFGQAAAAPTVLTSIRTLDGPLIGDRPPWALSNLEVPWGEVLSLEFSVLDFGAPERHRYAYRLRGLRDGWIDLDRRREITFTDLAPGNYVLQVRGRNGHGIWSTTEVPLNLRVIPPYWMTWWFRFALVLGIVGIGFGWHHVRTANLERRNRELLALKEQRERALEEAHRSGEALKLAYEQLRRLTGRLEAAKEDERKRIARELHDEMGQALTAAKINLQLLPGVPDAEERGRRIGDTVALVDRMIQHVRTLSLDLRPPLLDELGLIPAVRGYLEALAQRSGIKIEVEADALAEPLSPEIEITTFRVIQEALTNVLRHAQARGTRVRLRREPPWLGVTVADDGNGFDVEEALGRAAGGHHLGLLGIRERVEGLGGSVEFDSAAGRGTEIRVRVPLQI
jgi:signal transduction histidine kinase/ligand-binding sensor domain-containing protein